MRKNIRDYIENDTLSAIIYSFIVAWDKIIEEKKIKKDEILVNTEMENSSVNNETAQISTNLNEFYNEFWNKEETTLEELEQFAHKFLIDNLEFNAEGEKQPHKFQNIKRKNQYPTQSDIVDYVIKTKYADKAYIQASVQSMISRRLAKMLDMDKRDPLGLESDGIIVRSCWEYRLYTVVDKRRDYKERLLKNIKAVDAQGVRYFAKLSKSDIYQLGSGGIVIFFDEDVDLSGTKYFLRKFINKSYVCDMFDIKGRLIVLLDGDEEEMDKTINDLCDLVNAIFTEQNKPPKTSLKKKK